MEHNELAGHAGLFTYRFRGIGLQAAEIPNLVFAGTSVAQGNGQAVVIHTGMITKFDKIARLTQNVEDNVSPLQRELNHLTRQIIIFALCIGVVFFILDVLFVHNPLAETFIFSLGMVVVFILEGLLPTVTRALAMAVQRMSKRNALVKKLSSVESLGSTSVICADKTGMLTRNEMTVEYLWNLNHEYQVSGTGYAPKGEITVDGAVHHAADDAVLRELVTGERSAPTRTCTNPNRTMTCATITCPPPTAVGKCMAIRSKSCCWCSSPKYRFCRPCSTPHH